MNAMITYNKVTIEDLSVAGKRVLVRCDFNVPMKDGVITNDNRITAALPTIRYLMDQGGRLILCSHLGKPKNGPEAKFSLAPVAVRLSELLGKPVTFVDDDLVAGPKAQAAAAAMKDGDVILLQNTRFRKEETKNEETFSRELAALCDVYVDDAFGSCHRAHCSTVGVASFVKETAVGYLMQKEIQYLGNAVENPQRPFLAILGGAKVADKLSVIENLLNKVDTLIIGGGMAYTFLKAQGLEVGTSLVDNEKVDYCGQMLQKARDKGVKLLLPVDTVVAASFPDPIDAPVETRVVDSDKIPADMMGLDIGPKTQELFAKAAKEAKTVVWNGPMGVFENPVLRGGTDAVAKALAETDAVTVIGGGDSAAAVMQLGYADKMTHISTGGGASLEYLEGKVLPGIAAIADKK
jgi:phosphoglycerate kinase